VYPRVPGELIGAAEAFRASSKGTGMRLLASVRPDMAGLMLETVKGLLAQRALVGTWQVLASVVLGGLSILQERSHEAHGGSGHGLVGRGRGLLSLVCRLAVVVEDVGEVSKTQSRCWMLHVISTSGVGKKFGERTGGDKSYICLVRGQRATPR
jgi:hypothetical protein